MNHFKQVQMIVFLYKRQRIPKEQSNKDNPAKLTTQAYTRRRKTKQKHNIICVGHHYAQKNTNDVNKT